MTKMKDKYSLFILDQDGTIAIRNSIKLLPEMSTFFRQIKGDEEIQVAVASNKGGVGMGEWGWAIDEPDRPSWLTFEKLASYPTRITAMMEMNAIAAEITRLSGKTPRLYYSYQFQFSNGTWTHPDGEREWSWDWHKPNPGMLNQALKDFNLTPGLALMVGDRDEDRLAARDAGVDFMWAEDFWREVMS